MTPEKKRRVFEDALRELREESRIDLLATLAEAYPEELSRETLLDATGLGDDALDESLSALLGRYVHRTGPETYRLLRGGVQIQDGFLAAHAEQRTEIDTFEIDSSCVDCGHSLTASYRDDRMQIRCPDCETLFYRHPFPVGGIQSRSPRAVVDAFERQIRSHITQMRDGLCPRCSGPVAQTLITDFHEEEFAHEFHDGVFVMYQCERCFGDIVVTLPETVIDRPALVEFFTDHGRDITDIPCWEFEFCLPSHPVEVVSSDPRRFQFSVELDDEQLVVTVDESMRVTETNRLPVE